ncbi:hypothetical protein PHYPSEUDO_014356 [Phytophthora pseudosyringae]|uniref:Uncharacterized protein n=1 Tax=Phytophthora pseudosyringae TaxID=221518 RepID=A0A8T1WMA9_9STRA|nr:hypothetical protein PHYPSEUDO_014356 [Phytophthora pseudosyringae]
MEPLRVTYRTPLDGELRAFMAAQLVKYLLFMRGQIPCLYDELLQFVERRQLQQQQEQVGSARRRRLPASGGTKKAVKCVEAAELLFGEQLDAVFSLKVKRVALVFGSSMMSPREAVVVDFEESESELEDVDLSLQTDQEDMSLEDSQTLTPPSPPRTREKVMRLCAQKLLRAVFSQAMEQFSSALSATKLHVAVLAERQSTRIPGFLPKQQFKLRLPKDKRGLRTHYITICGGVYSKDLQQSASEQASSDSTSSTENGPPHPSTSVNSSVEPSSAATSDSNSMWYVLEKPIPGFIEVVNTLEGQ